MANRVGKYKLSKKESALSLRDGGAVEGNLRVTGTQTYTKFDLGAQVTLDPQSDGTAFSGVAGETNQWRFRCGNTLSVVAIGDNQTLVGPALNTAGLDVSGDATDDDGWECRGKSSLALGTLNKDYFTVGTSPAFYAKCKFSIADVSDSDRIMFGFAKDEAFTATTDNYNDLATIGVVSGDIKTDTIVGNASNVLTDITSGGGDGAGNWADAGQHTLAVYVSKTGVVTYTIDGAAGAGAVDYTFTNGLNVTPFWYHIHAASSTAGIVWNELEFGLQ